MTALTAEELSVALSMLSSIKAIALRFCILRPPPKQNWFGEDGYDDSSEC